MVALSYLSSIKSLARVTKASGAVGGIFLTLSLSSCPASLVLVD